MVASPDHPGQSKRQEEREFYMRLAIRERWSKRELERQFKTALFERAVLHPPKVTPAVTQRYPEALSEFLELAEGGIPKKYKELIAPAVALTTQCPYCLEVHEKS
jgi:alkylhydroperoxidase/carboxymuconolactone decarboxylase family protein YurZ